MMMSNKGEIEIQFHWLFVIIAGFVILGFFLFIVFKQQSISELKTTVGLASDIRAILIGAQVAGRTLNIISIPETKISFDCELKEVNSQKISYSTFSVGRKVEENKLQVIFAPKEIEALKLYTWSYEWKMPFKTTNFLFLSNPKHRIVLVEKPTPQSKKICSFINSTLPEQLNMVYLDRIPISQLEDQNNDFESIVFCHYNSNEIANIASMYPIRIKAKQISAVNVVGDEAQGTLTFFQDGKDRFINPIQSDYADAGLLFGAIFSPDASFYSCNMQKAVDRLHLVAEIYKQKAEELELQESRRTPIRTECHANLIDATKSPDAPLKTLADKNIDNINRLYSAARRLSFINTQLQVSSCPLIY